MKTVKWFSSSGSSPKMKGDVPKCQRTIDEVISEAVLKTRESEVNEEDQVMEMIDLTEPAASPEVGLQVDEVVSRAHEAMYLYSRSTMLMFDIMRTSTSLRMGGLCCTLWIWCSVT